MRNLNNNENNTRERVARFGMVAPGSSQMLSATSGSGRGRSRTWVAKRGLEREIK